MSSKTSSYLPAENLERMVKGLCKMLEVPFPVYFRNITAKPKNWPKELQQIYRIDRHFFKDIKKFLPGLNYDEIDFLMRDLGLVKQHNVELKVYLKAAREQVPNGNFFDKFQHFVYKISPYSRILSCYVPTEEGKELVNFYGEENLPHFYSLLFLKFLCLKTPLFSIIVQHPKALNLGRRQLLFRTSKEVERAFDSVIKPHFLSREATSTEAKNIRRWLQYFGLLYTFDGIFHFDIGALKTLLVGAVHTFINQKLATREKIVKWGDLHQDLIEEVHVDPHLVDIEELVGLILEANSAAVRWISSERGDLEFRHHKGKQVLELRDELDVPETKDIEKSDFLRMPSIPDIEKVDVIKTGRLDELWREPL